MADSSQTKLKKKVKVPNEFIRHILSLGFNEKDSPLLYEHKDDWLGINSGGSLLCAKPDCNFSTKIASDDLFEHCRVEHKWKDYPCKEENCNYVAYSSTAFSHHLARFHSDELSSTTTKYQYPCRKPNCKASFKARYLRRLHENIHDNVLIKCVFCPFRCVEPAKIMVHHRVHFNIRDYKCDECQIKFHTQGNLNAHFKARDALSIFLSKTFKLAEINSFGFNPKFSSIIRAKL